MHMYFLKKTRQIIGDLPHIVIRYEHFFRNDEIRPGLFQVKEWRT